MKKKKLLIVFGLFLIFVVVVPFLIPVKPLPGLMPAQSLGQPGDFWIDVGGFSARYRLAGEDPKTILFLHGMGSNLNTWDAVMPSLSANARVIAVDLPGLGLTRAYRPDLHPKAYSLSGRAAFVIEFLDVLEIDEVILVGNSAGGKLAAYITAQYPDRVEQLILLDAAIFGGGTPAFLQPLFQTPQMDHLGPYFARVFFKQWIGLLESNRYDPSQDAEGWLFMMQRPLKAQGWDQELWQLIRYSGEGFSEEMISQIKVPTLVLHGEADILVPLEDSQKIAALINQSRFEIIPKSAHLPQEENPQAVIQWIASLLP